MFVRLLLGEPEWIGDGKICPAIGAIFTSRTRPFDSNLLTTLSFESAPYLNTLVIDSTLKDWSGIKRLNRFFAKGNRLLKPLVTLGINARDFEKRIRHIVVSYQLDCEARLTQQLSFDNGSVSLIEWKRQFAAMGFQTFPSYILPCVRSIPVAEIVLRLRFHDLPSDAKCCVLTGVGSDHLLLRSWEAEHGLDRDCGHLVNTIQLAKFGETVLLFVDAIMSGAQIVAALKPLKEAKKQKRLRLLVRPGYATRFGLERFANAFDSAFAEVDTSTSMILENINPQDYNLKFPELMVKLGEFAVAPDLIAAIVSFCRKVGAELKAIEDGEDIPDLTVGLGGFGLGLTTLIGGKPSKGVLPVLRLGGSIKPAGIDAPMIWVPLIRHRNTSGAG